VRADCRLSMDVHEEVIRHHVEVDLLPGAGVLPHVAEKVLNHVTPGIAGVYQRHNWIEEKKDALERLATLVLDIVK